MSDTTRRELLGGALGIAAMAAMPGGAAKLKKAQKAFLSVADADFGTPAVANRWALGDISDDKMAVLAARAALRPWCYHLMPQCGPMMGYNEFVSCYFASVQDGNTPCKSGLYRWASPKFVTDVFEVGTGAAELPIDYGQAMGVPAGVEPPAFYCRPAAGITAPEMLLRHVLASVASLAMTILSVEEYHEVSLSVTYPKFVFAHGPGDQLEAYCRVVGR